VQAMQTSNFYYGRNIVSQDSQTASHLVSRHVVRYQSKAWSQRTWAEESSWSWELQYCMGVASQTAPWDGSSRAGQVVWSCRS